MDLGLFYVTRTRIERYSNHYQRVINILFWGASVYVLLCFIFLQEIFMDIASKGLRRTIIASIFFILCGKVLWTIYLTLSSALQKGLPESWQFKPNSDNSHAITEKRGRRNFLWQTAILGASIPIGVAGFGIINRAYDYQIHRRRIVLPHLPRSFHGLTIGQISDIHAGSFYNKNAVHGGVDLLMNEKPDLIFFTGDLVNRDTDESLDYLPTFSKVKAPLGVYSVLGNHDYGDYRSWSTEEAKQKNLAKMKEVHRHLGWQLLCNENRILTMSSDSLAILGVENWGVRRFSKHGDLKLAHTGTESSPVKILLSHDPSHWEAQVLHYPDIDLTFSGHTHGFQFGVEIGDVSWSPAQYLYKQWAGLYQQGTQYIYVNRGYGFIGLPGRIGISPEVTLVELIRA